MNYFYILMVPASLALLFEWAYLYRISKHDRVLFEFCQIRRDLMEYFRANGFDMGGAEYRPARNLYRVLDIVIHDFNENKSVLFNGREFLRFIKAYQITPEEELEWGISTLPEMRKLHSRFGKALSKAFFAYTPFFRQEWFFRAAILVLGFLVRMGLTGLRKTISDLRETMRIVHCFEASPAYA